MEFIEDSLLTIALVAGLAFVWWFYAYPKRKIKYVNSHHPPNYFRGMQAVDKPLIVSRQPGYSKSEAL